MVRSALFISIIPHVLLVAFILKFNSKSTIFQKYFIKKLGFTVCDQIGQVLENSTADPLKRHLFRVLV